MLSSQFATCIAQDKTGYIWIGTVDGLNRYDGHEMKIYRNSKETYPNLANNNIRTIYPDSKGRLWIGTIWGLSLFIPENDAFELLSSSANPAGLESSSIYQVTESKDGQLYIAAGKAIYKYNEEEKQFTPLIKVSGGDITCFYLCDDGNIWLGQDVGGGLKYFSIGNGYQSSTLPSWISSIDSARMTTSTIMDIELQDSLLWIATRGNGLKKFDFSEKTINNYLTGTYSSFVVDLYQDQDGNLWSCDFSGLKIYDRSSDDFYGYYPQLDDKTSIKRNPTTIIQDYQNNYWVVYSEKGFGFSPVDRGFQIYDDSQANDWTLNDINVISVAEDAKGNLWTGGYNGGISVFHWAEDSVSTFHFEENDPNSLGQGSIFDLHLDQKDEMWIGSYMGGLQRFDREANSFETFVNDPNNTETIGGNDVRAIAEDDSGNFWLAVHGRGIDYFDRETGIFKHYTPQNSNLSIEWTSDVILDDQNNLWIATSNGLNKLEAGRDSFEVFVAYEPSDTSNLQSNDVICLHESSDGTIWVGTSNGLHAFDATNNSFVYHSKNFNNQYICSIESDLSGNFWISTHNGLTKYTPASGQVFNFDSKDGLQSNDFNIRSSYYDGDQYFFFGGPYGLNVFDPQNINYNLDPPKVVLTNFRLFNKTITEFGENKILQKHISVADQIVMDYKNNFFTIEYAAINFMNPEKNTYAYRMEGFEEGWNEVGNKREATYTNLDPGTYTFRVKAANNDGIWNEEGAAIDVVIVPPWYMTPWFRILATIGGIVILYFSFQLRTSVLRRQKHALTALINERTKKIHEKNQMLKKRTFDLNNTNHQLENQKQTIEKQANELKLQASKLRSSNNNLQQLNSTKDRLFSIIAHDVRAPFSTIIGFSSLLQEMAADGNTELTVEYAQYINESSNQVLALLENLLYWARSQTNEIIMKPGKITLKQIFNDNIKLLNESAIRKNIEINTSQLDFEVVLYADQDMLRTVVRNLLSNAIKFTPNKGRITIISEIEGSKLKIRINDTGRGMNKRDVKKLKIPNQLYTTPGTHGEKGSGLGLTISREFIKYHDGEMIIESKQGEGSSFGFMIPLNEKA